MITDFMAIALGNWHTTRASEKIVKNIIIKKSRNKLLPYKFRIGGSSKWHLMNEAGLRKVIRSRRLKKAPY